MSFEKVELCRRRQSSISWLDNLIMKLTGTLAQLLILAHVSSFQPALKIIRMNLVHKSHEQLGDQDLDIKEQELSGLMNERTSRRWFLAAPVIPVVVFSDLAAAKVSKFSIETGRKAANSIVDTQRAQKSARDLAQQGKWDALRDFFDDPVMSSFEDNMTKVINSEGLLTSDDIKDIGTIRRYGLAADYIITIGSAKAQLEGDENGVIDGKEISRTLRLANDSIDEIVTILRSARAIT